MLCHSSIVCCKEKWNNADLARFILLACVVQLQLGVKQWMTMVYDTHDAMLCTGYDVLPWRWWHRWFVWPGMLVFRTRQDLPTLSLDAGSLPASVVKLNMALESVSSVAWMICFAFYFEQLLKIICGLSERKWAACCMFPTTSGSNRLNCKWRQCRYVWSLLLWADRFTVPWEDSLWKWERWGQRVYSRHLINNHWVSYWSYLACWVDNTAV